ncbi:MAG: porin family protein [bacterium]|nr:porin family protein [bacterium]
MRHERTLLKAIALLLILLPSSALGNDRTFSLDAGLGGDYLLEQGYASRSGEYSMGLRAAYSVSDRWAIEGGLSRTDDNDWGGHSLYFVDFSARRSLRRTDRLDFFMLGGPGFFRLEFDSAPGNDLPSESSVAFHLGLGLEFDFSEHFYLRPDVRQRWLDEKNLGDAFRFEGSLAVGFRF